VTVLNAASSNRLLPIGEPTGFRGRKAAPKHRHPNGEERMHNLDIDPESRSFRLRRMYWNAEQNAHLQSAVLTGSGEKSLVGRAKDFAIVLDATQPVIQPLDMIAGVALVSAAEGSSVDLGYYDGHYNAPGEYDRPGDAAGGTRASDRSAVPDAARAGLGVLDGLRHTRPEPAGACAPTDGAFILTEARGIASFSIPRSLEISHPGTRPL